MDPEANGREFVIYILIGMLAQICHHHEVLSNFRVIRDASEYHIATCRIVCQYGHGVWICNRIYLAIALVDTIQSLISRIYTVYSSLQPALSLQSAVSNLVFWQWILMAGFLFFLVPELSPCLGYNND